ncbi:branched-chain-amino-acid aminotransferase 3, chloroplastic-like isoform X2 [Gossypium australe]|uniref:Branched-chain-amino-acid aminotransferase 3, chloroplastic-like isoform X2 n=1 Tax=Gossypium australe TaxID=47621 RepID=A0A5B6W6T2_9ROSI|nr:branched-chain-amino-acid aminotransferase 3, chloroplastic-like isoform X2 [Gossypium australe]
MNSNQEGVQTSRLYAMKKLVEVGIQLANSSLGKSNDLSLGLDGDVEPSCDDAKVQHHLQLAATSSHGWLRATPSDAHSETSVDKRWDSLAFNPVKTDYIYISPSAAVLSYGQGIIENLKAYKNKYGSIVLFRVEENGLRMRVGADRMCMPVPLSNKGFLHVRPQLMGNGPILSLTPAPKFIFLIYFC